MNLVLGANSTDLTLLANSFPMVLVWTTNLQRPEKQDNFTSLGLTLFQECSQDITLVQGCIGQDNTKYGHWVSSSIKILVTMLASLNIVFSNLIWLRRSKWLLHWHFHASRIWAGEHYLGRNEREELLDGDPSKVPHGDDEEQDHDEDDDELDDGDDGGPGPSGGKVSKKPLDDSEDIFDKDKDPEEMTLQELIDAQPEHWKSGKAGDGKVYLNDDGEKVKLNVKGYPYKIGDDGRRLFKTSLRPKETYSPEEWRKLSQSDRNTILKSEKKKLEKKEADDKAKRIVEEKKKKALKKEKKDSKKDKDEPKSKDDEEDDESKKDDSYSKSKKSDAGVGEVVKNKVTLPITCTSTYLDLYDIVDDDDVHGKRYIDCRKAEEERRC